MKNPLLAVTVLCIIFMQSACGAVPPGKTARLDNRSDVSFQGTPTFTAGKEMAKETSIGNRTFSLNAESISKIRITGPNGKSESIQSDPVLIREFCSFLKNRKYTAVKELPAAEYHVEFFDGNGSVLFDIFFAGNAIGINRSAMFGDTLMGPGTYETAGTDWTVFSFYLQQLTGGVLLNPGEIPVSAQIHIPTPSEGYYKAELADKGNKKINTYEVLPLLHSFVENHVNGRDFIITNGKRYANSEDLQKEKENRMKEAQCIAITYGSSDFTLGILSPGICKEAVSTYSLTVVREPQQSKAYRLFTENYAFTVKADDEFDSNFDALFDSNRKTSSTVTPEKIKELFDKKEPYFIEYVCSNLGISEWTGREPDKVEIRKQTMAAGSKPFTIVSISNPFDVRLLLYKQAENRPLEFLGEMAFSGWPDTPEYRIQNDGRESWVYGLLSAGHGTGVSMMYRSWYRITDSEVRLAACLPDDCYEMGPEGEYRLKAEKISFAPETDRSVVISYNVTRGYKINLTGPENNADEVTTTVDGHLTARFTWNESQKKFVPPDGIQPDPSRLPFALVQSWKTLSKKCNSLLENHYEQLYKNLKSVAAEPENDQRRWKLMAYRAFLNDCPESEKKTGLQKLLPREDP